MLLDVYGRQSVHHSLKLPVRGTIACTSPVYAGSQATCTISPSFGFTISALTDNGSNVLSAVSNGIYNIGKSRFSTGVDKNHEVTATFTAPQFDLTVHTGGTGGGSLNSNPAGIACVTGDSRGCSAPFTYGDRVIITQAPFFSTFTGWTGDCGGSNGCEVTMNGPRDVTAHFSANPTSLVIEGETPANLYYKVNDALTASAGRSVKGRDIVFTETGVVMDSSTTIRFKGGYNEGFTSQTGYSIIDGSLKIQKGILRVERVKVR